VPPLAANAARSVFIPAPIRGKRGELFDLGFQNWLGKLETGELEIAGQQVGIGMRQAFQYHDGSGSSEVEHPLTLSVPTSVGEHSADSIQAGSVPGSVQPPQRRHQ
jgi:hypothetical protein